VHRRDWEIEWQINFREKLSFLVIMKCEKVPQWFFLNFSRVKRLKLLIQMHKFKHLTSKFKNLINVKIFNFYSFIWYISWDLSVIHLTFFTSSTCLISLTSCDSYAFSTFMTSSTCLPFVCLLMSLIALTYLTSLTCLYCLAVVEYYFFVSENSFVLWNL
jgi:hypothetical protein